MSATKAPVVHFVDGSAGQWPWSRQLPHGDTHYRGLQFDMSPMQCASADWLVVFSSLPAEDFSTYVPRERRVFIAAEPEAFHRYQTPFLQQFGTVVTPQARTRHPNVIQSQPAINWFAGVRFVGSGQYACALRYEDLLVKPTKTRLCSVVTSNKQVTRGHRQRLEFVNLLQKEFGGVIDFFGSGVNPINDKDEALASYRYHIALENSVSRDYWTEKLADPLLRFCFPIYYGCSNIQDYFDAASLTAIDIGKATQALKTIERVLASDIDVTNAMAVQSAHQRVMEKYNVFSLVHDVIESSGQATSRGTLDSQQTILSDHACKEFKWSRRAKRALRQLLRLGDH